MERPTKPETEIQEESANYKVKRFLTSQPLLHFKAKGKRFFFKKGNKQTKSIAERSQYKEKGQPGGLLSQTSQRNQLLNKSIAGWRLVAPTHLAVITCANRLVRILFTSVGSSSLNALSNSLALIFLILPLHFQLMAHYFRLLHSKYHILSNV